MTAELEHFGVKGMKWGVRKDRTPTKVTTEQRPGSYVRAKGGDYQKASKDAITAAKYKQKAKRSSPDSLSNEELQTLVKRMNLEQQYRQLSANDRDARMTKGQKFLRWATSSKGQKDMRAYYQSGQSAYKQANGIKATVEANIAKAAARSAARTASTAIVRGALGA